MPATAIDITTSDGYSSIRGSTQSHSAGLTGNVLAIRQPAAAIGTKTFDDILGGDAVVTPLATARSYIARGWAPVPIPDRQKGPKLKGWGRLRLDADSAGQHFSDGRQNVGVILGNASGGLVDVDLDCPEARELASDFLPHTPAIFGRPGNPQSHWLYCVPDMKTEQVREPTASGGLAKTLLELRSNTDTDQPSQTVFPGSTHETGEPIEWSGAEGHPAACDRDELLAAFRRLGAASILARAFPKEGGRHNATLALIGFLTRAGLTEEAVSHFTGSVRRIAGADPKKSLRSMARDAAKRLDSDKQLSGLPALRDAFGERAADRVAELINYDSTRTINADDFDELPELSDLELLGGPSAKPSELRFLTPVDCATSPARQYIIKGLLASCDVGCFYGAPGAGKSLISPYLAYRTALGLSAFGMRTRPGRVFYVAAEDPHGMRGRVTALKMREGDAPDFILVEGVSDLLAGGSPDLAALRGAIADQQPTLVFIDTLAMAFPGLEENAAADMGRVVAIARSLTLHGAAVILIHHDTKAQSPTPRGHSLLNGALDMALQLFPKDETGVVRAKLTKNRNGTCDRDIAFRIATECLGIDEDGDAITAALVAELAPGAVPRQVKMTASERAALLVFDGLSVSGAVTEEAWRTACLDARTVSGSEDKKSRQAATRRAFQGLASKGLLLISGGLVQRPGSFGNAFDDE